MVIILNHLYKMVLIVGPSDVQEASALFGDLSWD